MKSGLMNVYHNNPDNFIDNWEYLHQYWCLILSKHKCINIQTSITQIINAQLNEWKTPTCLIISICFLHKTFKVQWTYYKWKRISCKTFWTCHHLKQFKNHYTILAITLHATKPKKQNKSNSIQTLQPDK